jgi:hypothetical protein
LSVAAPPCTIVGVSELAPNAGATLLTATATGRTSAGAPFTISITATRRVSAAARSGDSSAKT